MKEAKSQQATPGYNAATSTSGPGYSRGTNKYAKNQWSGHSNDGREVNFGRGPTGGSTKVPAGKETTMGCHQPQVRTPGGTKEMPKRGQTSFDYGRGPTKGNQQ